MVRQAQTYLAAAVSAVVLNAAAIAAFVLITLLAAVGGWSFSDPFGSDQRVAAPGSDPNRGGAAEFFRPGSPLTPERALGTAAAGIPAVAGGPELSADSFVGPGQGPGEGDDASPPQPVPNGVPVGTTPGGPGGGGAGPGGGGGVGGGAGGGTPVPLPGVSAPG